MDELQHTDDELEKLTSPKAVYKKQDIGGMYKTRASGWKPVSSGMTPSDVEETVKHHARSGTAARFSEKQGKFLLSPDSGMPPPKGE